MHWYDDAIPSIGVAEDVMASLAAVEAPTGALQSADGVPGRDPRKPWRHAPTVTRLTSTGSGIGSPWAVSDSK